MLIFSFRLRLTGVLISVGFAFIFFLTGQIPPTQLVDHSYPAYASHIGTEPAFHLARALAPRGRPREMKQKGDGSPSQ